MGSRMADSISSLAKEALRRSPELFLLGALVVAVGWFIDRRDQRFDAHVLQRDKAFLETQGRVLDHISESTRAVQRMADLLRHDADGWNGEPAKERASRGG